MEQTWTVVQFIEDGSIAAVPTIWIQNGSCYWPPYPAKHIPNLLKKCDVADESWPTFKIKMFKDSTFDNYLKAREKAKLAEETSDLQSEAEPGNKRKRITKEFSSSEESLQETSSRSPQELGRTSTMLDDTSIYFHSDHRVQDEVEIPRTGGRNESSSSQNILIENVDRGPSCSRCDKRDEQVRDLINQIHVLRALMTETLQEVTHLRKDVITSRTTTETNTTSIFTKYSLQFPLQTIQELKQFDDIMQNKAHFNDAVKELANYGGSGNYMFIKRMLTSLMSNDLALMYSWLGRKNKEDFHSLNVARLLICAAEHGKMAANRNETEESIKQWLRRAGDRKTTQMKKF